MSQANIKMGPEAKVQVDGVTVDVTDSSVRVEIKNHDSNDSADATYDNSKTGRRKLVFSIQGHVMTDTPWSVGTATKSVTIYPWGLAFPAHKYAAPTAQVTVLSSTHPAKSGEPSTVSFEGHSTGAFSEP